MVETLLANGQALKKFLKATMLQGEVNLQLLDESTNDLNVNTMGVLEEVYENFAGCALIISHDRRFLGKSSIGFRHHSIFRHGFPDPVAVFLARS
jgi:ATPase subunit of ABC transporter with duplicated ATPase domains